MKKGRDYNGFLVFLAVGTISFIFSAAGTYVNWTKNAAANTALICLTGILSALWLITGWRAGKSSSAGS